MPNRPYSLDLRFAQGDYGLSARRLREFTELGQINVFSRAISERSELNDAADFVDVIHFDGGAFSLVGCTLAELLAADLPVDCGEKWDRILSQLAETDYVGDFIREVQMHLDRCAERQAVRNQHQPFLPAPKPSDSFGVTFVFSTLQRRLYSLGQSKAGSSQWIKTIENFQKKGLRAEELECSQLITHLVMWGDVHGQTSADELVTTCDFNNVRLSVIPMISNAQKQIRFAQPPERTLKPAKKLPKAQTGQTREVAGFDSVLGYRIEQVAHQTLWGHESHWQAVLYDGTVLRSVWGQTLFPSRDVATEMASVHAKQNFPKRLALGRFGRFAWTGGKDYREWLITLPYYPASYLSGHFDVRNVLAHVRCDIREGADGERVLMLHEVQSDWAQRARRAVSSGDMRAADEVPPPFFKEWPALAMKLVLLHAACQGFDAVAWTCGAHQVVRYNGLGAAGLIELYDRTLPREVNRMLKPFGRVVEELGVFVPTNFGIKQSEFGYEVYTAENELLATARTLEDAQQFVPPDAHELLYDVHGVRLSHAMCKEILNVGFPAWG